MEPTPQSPPDAAPVGGLVSRLRAELLERWTPGGLPPRPGLAPRLDATAWGILTLPVDTDPSFIEAALETLKAAQLEDGRIPARPDAPTAIWTTALAALAFGRGGKPFRDHSARAIAFLLEHEGIHHPRTEKTPVSHDTDLVGWPWVEGSAAWVEPTALALHALRHFGEGEHPRAEAARTLLFDRQLPGEGWNHGNVEVLGKRFTSVVSSTGLVLFALSDQVRDARIDAALTYLEEERPSTPHSLAWQRLGLRAWDAPTARAERSLGPALDRAAALAPVDSAHLCQSIFALTYPVAAPEEGEASHE